MQSSIYATKNKQKKINRGAHIKALHVETLTKPKLNNK